MRTSTVKPLSLLSFTLILAALASSCSTGSFSAAETKRRSEKVIADETKAIALNPNDAVAYENRAKAKSPIDLDGAIEDYTKAIELNPNYDEAYGNRGAAKNNKGDLDGAIADETKAIALNPSVWWAYYVRGMAKQKKGDSTGANSDLEKASELSNGRFRH
jgi:tetratricopeptide (TPR) repeat protein